MDKIGEKPVIKAVIFDLDGTVCDTLPLCIEAFKRAIEPLYGKPVTDDVLIATFGPSEEGTIKALIPDHYDQGVSDYLSAYGRLHAMCPKPFEGITETIGFLRESGVVTALVTGKGARSCRVSLEFYSLNGSFDAVETGSPDGMRKTEGILAVLERFHILPEEAIYVGDAPTDVLLARAAGVRTASALWGSIVEEDAVMAAKPAWIFHSVADFRSFIEGVIPRPASERS
jgi:phosphoglycolate phosphatase/pyrophosphatase PpaX